MAEKNSHITVKVPIQSIRDSLRKKIVSEHSDLITEIIMGNLLKTQVGLQQLYNAFGGVRDVYRFKPGDKVYIEIDSIGYSWKFNKDKTKLSDKYKDGRILSIVLAIDKHSQYPYKIQSTCLDDTGTEVKIESDVMEERLALEEEWPFDDGLPF